ncbi:hypothetical protein D3879_18790 [Pseudomonas cavernicola]|uniref:Uncharacterized protein n=1 Tax=Pseudomonas cavernicola TaxID=2320866 RepID=A0A418XC64_9PSED|nr:hypothetical protein D3879_18790 [Pseudomonas cavernicola]
MFNAFPQTLFSLTLNGVKHALQVLVVIGNEPIGKPAYSTLTRPASGQAIPEALLRMFNDGACDAHKSVAVPR